MRSLLDCADCSGMPTCLVCPQTPGSQLFNAAQKAQQVYVLQTLIWQVPNLLNPLAQHAQPACRKGFGSGPTVTAVVVPGQSVEGGWGAVLHGDGAIVDVHACVNGHVVCDWRQGWHLHPSQVCLMQNWECLLELDTSHCMFRAWQPSSNSTCISQP